MVIFKNEHDLKETIRKKKDLLQKAINGSIDVATFFKEYDSFFFTHALDGHESDDEEKVLFKKYKKDIDLFEIIETKILSRICSDEDSVKDAFIKDNRVSAHDAIKLLKEFLQPPRS